MNELLRNETLRKLDLFIQSDATGFAQQAWDRMRDLGIDMRRILPVAEWAPSYANGLYYGLKAKMAK